MSRRSIELFIWKLERGGRERERERGQGEGAGGERERERERELYNVSSVSCQLKL